MEWLTDSFELLRDVGFLTPSAFDLVVDSKVSFCGGVANQIYCQFNLTECIPTAAVKPCS